MYVKVWVGMDPCLLSTPPHLSFHTLVWMDVLVAMIVYLPLPFFPVLLCFEWLYSANLGLSDDTVNAPLWMRLWEELYYCVYNLSACHVKSTHPAARTQNTGCVESRSVKGVGSRPSFPSPPRTQHCLFLPLLPPLIVAGAESVVSILKYCEEMAAHRKLHTVIPIPTYLWAGTRQRSPECCAWKMSQSYRWVETPPARTRGAMKLKSEPPPFGFHRMMFLLMSHFWRSM